MRLALLSLLAVTLVACGDADDAADVADAPDTAAAEAEAEEVESFEPLTPPAQAAEPVGSAGTFRFQYIRGSGDTRDTTVIEGFLPPPMPADAAGSATLDAVPDYDIVVAPSSVTADIDLRRAGYVYVIVDEVGEVEAGLRWGNSIFAEKHDGLFRGTVHAFTFPPLWEATGASPMLQLSDDENEESILATFPLPVSASPAWAQPLTLPSVPEDTRLTFRADMTINDPDLVPILIYPSTFGQVGWGADEFAVDEFEMRSRERNGETALGTPYKVFAPHNDEVNGEAYIVLFRP